NFKDGRKDIVAKDVVPQRVSGLDMQLKTVKPVSRLIACTVVHKILYRVGLKIPYRRAGISRLFKDCLKRPDQCIFTRKKVALAVLSVSHGKQVVDKLVHLSS